MSHPENVGLRCANPTYPASKLFSEALKSHKLKQLTGKAIQCVLMELAVGSVIVDVGVWGFLEVLYRPYAVVELLGKLSFNEKGDLTAKA